MDAWWRDSPTAKFIIRPISILGQTDLRPLIDMLDTRSNNKIKPSSKLKPKVAAILIIEDLMAF